MTRRTSPAKRSSSPDPGEVARYQAIGHVVQASVEHAEGKPEAARRRRSWSNCCVSTVRRPGGPTARSDLARLWVTHGELEKALYLVQDSGVSIDSLPRDGKVSQRLEPFVLIRLRLLLAQNECDAAWTWRRGFLEQLDGSGRTARLIEALAPQVLAFQAKRDLDRPGSLRDGLVARLKGHIRSFLDEGEAMTKLLFQSKSRQAGARYAAGAASLPWDRPRHHGPPPAQLLIEPLISRELDGVLVEAGCSNQDIATRLVISLPIVKRHISEPLRQLGTGSRSGRFCRARSRVSFSRTGLGTTPPGRPRDRARPAWRAANVTHVYNPGCTLRSRFCASSAIQ